MDQLVPEQLLSNSNKILFITHLAIGDFTYLQTYFLEFSKKYPNISIDIWVDDVRRTMRFWKWASLKKYSLYDWLSSCKFIRKIYTQTYSPFVLRKSIRKAQSENYPIVITLTSIRSERYAVLARKISPNGFIVGLCERYYFYNFIKIRRYLSLNKALDRKWVGTGQYHISDLYAQWFLNFFNVSVETEARRPFINIPKCWIIYAKLKFMKWSIGKKSKNFSRVVFINPYAKEAKRSIPLDYLLKLLKELKNIDKWGDINFIINVTPEEYKKTKKFFDKNSLTNTRIFSADYNFFQLPAVISLCDLVISVETSVMHLASALKVPVVALMRQKTPEWIPWDKERSTVVWAKRRRDWVKDIEIKEVITSVIKFVGN
jgi:ADP-heptose:LPS heptosyltransferase